MVSVRALLILINVASLAQHMKDNFEFDFDLAPEDKETLDRAEAKIF